MSSQCSLPPVMTWVCCLAAACLDRATIQFSPVWLDSYCVSVLCMWNATMYCMWCLCKIICTLLFWRCMWVYFEQDSLFFSCSAVKTFSELSNDLSISWWERGRKREKKINPLDFKVCSRKMCWILNPSFFFWGEQVKIAKRYGSTEEVVSFLDRSFSGLLFSVHFTFLPT